MINIRSTEQLVFVKSTQVDYVRCLCTPLPLAGYTVCTVQTVGSITLTLLPYRQWIPNKHGLVIHEWQIGVPLRTGGEGGEDDHDGALEAPNSEDD